MRSFGDLNLEQQKIWFLYLEIKVAGLGRSIEMGAQLACQGRRRRYKFN